jgi:hypothetical protein
MSEPTEEQVRQAFASAGPIILGAGHREAEPGTVPGPDETWELPNGTAWVYRAGGSTGPRRPVIMADGFNSGPSNLAGLWAGLELDDYPLISEMRRRGLDVILLGFNERSASILDNAAAVKAAIMKATAQRVPTAPLAVGGFSMGGLVTRYALASMEHDGVDHRTGLYWSYDSPHRGAWIPISLQAFAHHTRWLDAGFSEQINSMAARQLLWRHISDWKDDQPVQDPERGAFLDRLQAVGGWPQVPRRIAVANGVATGVGTGLQPGALAVEGKDLATSGLKLHIQSSGQDALVAELRVVLPLLKPDLRHTSGMPDIDAAPGGTLAGFQLLAEKLNELGLQVNAYIQSHCFVPAGSAVDMLDPDSNESLYANISELDPSESSLDEFRCASQNEGHTRITEELCTWLLDRMPD